MYSGNHPPPLPRNGPLRVRLNSGNEDILASDMTRRQRPPLPHMPSSQSSSRSLTQPTNPFLPKDRSAPQPSDYQGPPGPPGPPSNRLVIPQARGQRYRDEPRSPSPLRSPVSYSSSRRSSWSSEGSRDSRYGPFASPFDDSRAPSRAGSDDDAVNTQTVSDKYNILPSAGLLLFPEDIEKDDWLHNPDLSDKDSGCDACSGRGLVNVGGLLLITIGVLLLFIGYPILTFIEKLTNPVGDACTSNPMCVDTGRKIPTLKNIRTGLIDPDTPKSAMSRKSYTGKTQSLVFSDEFNKDGRTFYDNDDAYFQAVDLWYGVTMDLEWYDPDAVSTANGTLNIKFDAFQNHNLNYRSGMLQSWNKMCFKGGYMEASISLPGRGDTIGFWPGFWAMGNLGRPGYAATTDGMWPYSYHHDCDLGITKNQSEPGGLSSLPGMRLPACTCKGEDHPRPGKSRSAPEIDAIEASVGYLEPPDKAAIGSASQSCQVAPFDIYWRPDYDYVEIYDDSITKMNEYAGGVFQQAISGVTNLNNHWYDGQMYQTYAFDYQPGDKGQVAWYVGKDRTWTLDARALRPNGNVGQRMIPEEPMAMILNFGMSNGFAALNLTGLSSLMPATMRIDYVRIYQDEDNPIVTCDPPDFPTTKYIREHPEPYSNPNLTLWSQTKYDWPKNSLVDNCKA